MSSGAPAQSQPWKSREQGDEARYVHEKEKAQLDSIRQQIETLEEQEKLIEERRDEVQKARETTAARSAELKGDSRPERDFEGGFGGQEDLEDRYATTSGEH